MSDGASPFRVWFERPPPPAYARLLDGSAVILGGGSSGETPDGIAGAHAIIASSRVQYDGELMDRVPGLRVISRTGIGLDNVSLPDASARRIAVCHVPGGPTISTAEHAIALLLAVAKDVPRATMALRSGHGDFFNEYQGLELYNRCLGVVGLGQIGRRVAKVGNALEMRVIAFDPIVETEVAEALGVEMQPDLEALLSRADVVSLHAPLTEETTGLIGAARLAQMKPGAILINTARGGLVDEDALAEALRSGRLRGAGLDVFDPEPPDPRHELLQRNDVIATPHIAGATTASKDRLWRTAIAQALQVLRGERPESLANPDVWPQARARRVGS